MVFGPRSLARPLALASVFLLLVPGCGSNVDGDRGDNAPPPTELTPPAVGGVTLATDRAIIPADGSALTTATAVLSDARGSAIVDAPMLFEADLGDVTWVTTDPDDPTDLFPKHCVASTDARGVAECVFRAGFTPAKTYIRVAAPASLDIGAAVQVEFVR